MASFTLQPGINHLCQKPGESKLQLSATASPNLLARITQKGDAWQMEALVDQKGVALAQGMLLPLVEGQTCRLMDLELWLEAEQERSEFDRTTVITDLAEVARSLGAQAADAGEIPDHMKDTTITDLADIRLALSKIPQVQARLVRESEEAVSYPIYSGNFKIGKQADCDLILRGLLAPALAVTIMRRADGFYLNPSVKMRVNGQLAQTAHPLKNGDRLEIGKLKLIFKEPG